MKDRAYEIARNHNYDGYERNMFYKFFDKKTGSRMSVNEQLAEELHKPVIKKFKDNILTADLAETKSLFSKNKNVKYLYVS